MTVKKSCDQLLDDDVPDVEELVVPLWRGGLSEGDFKKLVCRDLTFGAASLFGRRESTSCSSRNAPSDVHGGPF